MIHWAWLIPAVLLGGSFGGMLMALIIAGDIDDD
jgi:hypothetical protein